MEAHLTIGIEQIGDGQARSRFELIDIPDSNPYPPIEAALPDRAAMPRRSAQKNTMRPLLLCVLLAFHAASAGATIWDYEYLNLDDLMDQSELIVIAEITEIQETLEASRVIQEIEFSPVTLLKGNLESESVQYRASFLPKYGTKPESHYLDACPGTKFLLFLTKKENFYESVLGPCGALKIDDNRARGGFGEFTELVLWYTDESKPQRFIDWENTSLKTVIDRITETAEQAETPKP